MHTRRPAAFAGSCIPGSLSLWLGGTSAYPGWILDYYQKILFVHERKSDMKTAVAYFWRLGSDNLVGFLCLVIREWQETGKVISHLGTLAASELKSRLERDEQGVVDVREPSEWKEGYIEGANAYSSGT